MNEIRGKTYQESPTKEADLEQCSSRAGISPQHLLEISKTRLTAIEHGTTTLECKSGYGLDLKTNQDPGLQYHIVGPHVPRRL
jgi:hypothetical protein